MPVPAIGDSQVAVNQRWRKAEITVLGVGEYGALHASAVEDNGDDTCDLPESLCSFLEMELPGIPIRLALLKGSHVVRLANGQAVARKQRSIPLGPKLRTAWGTVKVEPRTFVVVPGCEDTLIIGKLALEILGIFLNAELGRVARGLLELSFWSLLVAH